MAITSLTTPRTAVRSTVALKALMAVTGLILIGYLLAHMYGNLKVFSGETAFNDYAHHLRELGEPILPRSGALWIIRVVLLASVFAHMYAAFKLWGRARRARGGVQRYRSPRGKTGVQRTYASFTLRWGGVIILLFFFYLDALVLLIGAEIDSEIDCAIRNKACRREKQPRSGRTVALPGWARVGHEGPPDRVV